MQQLIVGTGINRLCAIPLNSASAYLYNTRIVENRKKLFIPNYSDQSYFGLTTHIGNLISDVASVGIVAKWNNWRTTLLYPIDLAWYSYRSEYDSISCDAIKYVNFGIIADYRYRFYKAACVCPGVLFNIFSLQRDYYYGAFTSSFLYSENKGMNIIVSPKLSLEITQFQRLSIEYTIAYSFYESKAWKDYERSYKAIYNGEINAFKYSAALNLYVY